MRVAVPAISFCQHPGLVELMRKTYPDCKLNTEAHPYYRSEEETIEYLQKRMGVMVLASNERGGAR